MSPIRRIPPGEPTEEPRPEPKLPGGTIQPRPRPDAAPVSPPPAEAESKPFADYMSDKNLADALEIIKNKGATKNAIQTGLKVSPELATALLAEMETRGIIGPAPKPGKKREILVTKWPPDTAPAESAPAEAKPAPVEHPPVEPEPAPAEPPPVKSKPASTGETSPVDIYTPLPEGITEDQFVQAANLIITEARKQHTAGNIAGVNIAAQLIDRMGLDPTTCLLMRRVLADRGVIEPKMFGSAKVLVDTWPPTLKKRTPEPVVLPDDEDTGDDPTDPSWAEPPPAETPPATPLREPVFDSEVAQTRGEGSSEPRTAETPPATPETPPAPPAPEKKGRFGSITSSFTSAFDRFMSKFRGESQPEEEKDYKGSWGDITRNATWGAMSVVASYTGVKFLADLGARAWQDLISNPTERKRIHDALLAKETEIGETTEPSAIDQKKAKLEEVINTSKFLTKEKKAELLAKLSATVEEYEAKDKSLRDEREGKIVALLKEAIQTRVKNTQLFKEGINTALAGFFVATGGTAVWAQGLRGPAFGAVAAFERHKEVIQSPERRMQYWREMTVRGVTDTLKNLGGGDAKFFSKRGGLNAVKGATNVLRAAGFASLTIEALTGSGLMDRALDVWEQRIGSATPEVPGGAASGTDSSGGAAGSPEATTASGAAGATGVAAAESAPSVEIPEAQIEAGLVKKGDGILKILERQGMDAKSALEAAREAGIVRAGGDTRLTTEAIGRLSVFTQTQPDGNIEITFFDSETDKLLTLEQAREAGFTYESGTVPGEIPTDKEIVSNAAQPNPDADIQGQDSPDVPNELLNGTFQIETDEHGNFADINYGEGDPLQRINDALNELDAAGHGDSAEARYLEETYRNVYQALYGSINPDLSSNRYEQLATVNEMEEARLREIAESATPEIDEPLRRFNGEAGKMKFSYDKETGAVIDASMPAYTPRPRDIQDALGEWGLTPEQVKDHFTEKNEYRQFIRETEKLSRQEALLDEMVEKGHIRTPEYQHLLSETLKLQAFVREEMMEEFDIRHKPIK